jgi:hypothetical protein
MPYIVIVYTSPIHNPTTIRSVFVYSNMKAVTRHSRGLLGYYDLRKKRTNTYVTYKSYFSLREITQKQFNLFNSIYRNRFNTQSRQSAGPVCSSD